ncbi:hypothetical protein V2J09_020073 [Rumex salicifolius]
MGCGSSKIDNSEAVALCRSRLAFVYAALHGRYALAEAHLVYINSFKSVGVSLHRFFNSAAGGDLASTAVDAAPSPVLNLPGDRKVESEEEEEEEYPGHHIKSLGSCSDIGSGHHHHLSGSSSDSHIHFNPDTDSDFEDEKNGSDLHHQQQMNFMQNIPTPSISYQQKPLSGSESIQIEMANPNPSYYPYFMSIQNPNPHLYGIPYDYGDGGYMGYGGGMGGFYGGPPPEEYVGNRFSSTSNAPPPPPPPPESTSSWDFLYPFEIIQSNYPPYTPSRASKASRDSKEVREEEGIPDLEEEDCHQEESVKEVHEEQKTVDENGDDGATSDGGTKSNSKVSVTEKIRVPEIEEIEPAEPNVSFEVHPVEDKVVVVVEESNVGDTNGENDAGKFKNVFDVVREIQVQFERASDSGGELNKILEVGKLPYHHKGSVSSKMLHAITPSLPSTPNSADEDSGLSSGILSATLQKLYLWEKKLLEEVKVEEKNRVAHDKKVKKLQRLRDKGAEIHKVNAAGSAIRDLSTKLKISIQIIEKISVEISKLRDEELWLQLNELIQGFSRMWKAMLKCHQSQFQAVQNATGLDKIVLSKTSDDDHLESVLQFEQELINWTSGFSNWIDTQKAYINSLNGWLLKCLVCEPEQTPDGLAPFSPGRAGAPPVFVICNQWAQALERLSEKEVVESMRVFAAMVLQLWERDKAEIQQRMAVVVVADKDVEKKVKNLQKEDMKIHKKIQALDKKMALDSGESNSASLISGDVYQSETKTSLQSGLQHIFEAMDKYTSESIKVYEELLERSNELGATMV